jgi:peroxiredoxin
MSPVAAGMRIEIGDQIPSVGLRATDGYLLNLRTFVGKQPAILVFFGGPSLRGRQREEGDELARSLAAAQPRLERAGIALVGITTDSEAQQKRYAEELDLPFLLFCDERRTAVSLLGVPTHEERRNVNARPTALAVGMDGTVLDVVEHVEPRGLIARLIEAIDPPE